MEKKIAVPTRDNNVDDHFGHCEYFTIFSIDENKQVTKKEQIDSPKECGCKSNIAGILKEMDVDTMLAGNMGQGAMNKISNQGIKVVRGCSGNILDVIGEYLKGNVNDSGITCSQHSDSQHHGHGHHHSGHNCAHNN